MQTLDQYEEKETLYFDTTCLESMHNGHNKKHGLSKSDKKQAKLYRRLRKSKNNY